jgi:DNA-binding XRE family transcriptional regulator
MDANKKARLGAAGIVFGNAEDFLELTDTERELVQLRLRLSDKLREQRRKVHLTQTALAKRIHSSQSRVAKMEAGDASVSFELLLTGLFAAGASRKEVADAIAS